MKEQVDESSKFCNDSRDGDGTSIIASYILYLIKDRQNQGKNYLQYDVR